MQGPAESIASDGEGATCLIEINVSVADNETEAAKVAQSVASSSLTKAAVWVERACYAIKNKLQYFSDKLKGQFRYRWMTTFILACFYAVRVYPHGYCFVTFQLGLFLSGSLWLFMSSAIREDGSDLLPVSSDSPPTSFVKTSDKFRPFVPLLPELGFWCIVNTLFCVALLITFIPEFNHPVSATAEWGYFIIWLVVTTVLLIDQLALMKKYKVFPFYYGNKKQGSTKGNNLLLVETRNREGWRSDCL
ncbi:hypothetical protein CASFOL_020330 [Castilleja foliolosa]|uniref:Uncharacterized protein n=1 Tax=Castilleja foliolosa TaxID=1961234 RepID=A0ABD3D0J0_9LAMI